MLAAVPAGVSLAAGVSPDDSDLIEYTRSEQSGTLSLSLSATSSRVNSTGSDAAGSRAECGLAQELIPISQRLWFGMFASPAPSHEQLNQGSGLDYAQFPSDAPLPQPRNMYWFTVDEDLVYLSFAKDWGPLNIAMFYRFCVHVHQLLIDPSMADTHLVVYTTEHPHHKANTALLCAMYALTIDHICPADAFYPFSEVRPPLVYFMQAADHADGICAVPRRRLRACRLYPDDPGTLPQMTWTHALTILQDILYGVHKAIEHGLLDLTTFNLEDYEFYEQVQNGDWNWITPEFLAFASPKDRDYALALSNGQAPPRQWRTTNPTLRNTVSYFRSHRISLVIRLNNPLYDKALFEDAGINHVDLYFDDGSNPSDEIVRSFISHADGAIRRGGGVAVHCKAGLGRTGVLIGAYLIWKYGFSAQETIGFMRLMRPGCVVGPQQHFMYENATKWVQWGVEDRLKEHYEKLLAEARSHVSTAAAQQAPAAVPPRTPGTTRTVAAPATVNAAPYTKPTPCVGQPRKSPSQSAKRRRIGEETPALQPPAPKQRTVSAESTTSAETSSEVDRSLALPVPGTEDRADAETVLQQLVTQAPATTSVTPSGDVSVTQVSVTETVTVETRTDEEVLGVLPTVPQARSPAAPAAAPAADSEQVAPEKPEKPPTAPPAEDKPPTPASGTPRRTPGTPGTPRISPPNRARTAPYDPRIASTARANATRPTVRGPPSATASRLRRPMTPSQERATPAPRETPSARKVGAAPGAAGAAPGIENRSPSALRTKKAAPASPSTRAAALRTSPQGARVGLRAHGHRRRSSCGDTDLPA